MGVIGIDYFQTLLLRPLLRLLSFAMTKILDFYKAQGTRTKVEKGIFDDFPDDIKEICKIIQGLLIHPSAGLKLYDLNFPKDRIDDRYIKTLSESISKIQSIENKPLIECRHPNKRIVNNCRHFAMFICSVLREKGISARCRCGYAIYLEPGWFEDHWICEYWNKNEKKWIKVDSQIDDIHILWCSINRKKIDFTNLPKEAFLCAGVVWKLYRQGLIDGNLFGFSLGEKEYGEWHIRGNLFRDFFALNKIEYTYQELNKLVSKNYILTKKELLVFDKIADLTINVDEKFDQIINFYKENKDLVPVPQVRTH